MVGWGILPNEFWFFAKKIDFRDSNFFYAWKHVPRPIGGGGLVMYFMTLFLKKDKHEFWTIL